MRFEFDPVKSAANWVKHGIDFLEAQRIWDDSERLEISARSSDEPRYQVIGRIGRNTWSAFIIYRNETIRIISVRRARREEEARYRAF
ncbi:MAG TPA: BrnT family toxin [Candidatus Acidoferrales bacterium]|nr:BrnT family toxin [Candidatus Acidoferrales bacterium]